MESRVLVTGASGFVGRHVLSKLAQSGQKVIAVSRKPQAYELENVDWISADLLKPDDCRRLADQAKADQLLHLAWYTEHGKFWSAIENFAWVRATLDLLENFQRSGGRRVIIAGTCAEYDWSFGYCTEELTPTRPSSVYGVCKDCLRRLSH